MVHDHLLNTMDVNREDNVILDREGTILDNIEDAVEDESGRARKPFRNAAEGLLDKIPRGPLGKIGEGNVAGFGGYFAIKTGQLAVVPIPGVRQPGFHAISHGVQAKDDYELHIIRINAASRKVAEVACEYEIASPSNIDFVTSEVEAVDVKEIKSRPTYSTYEFTVEVADRGVKE